MGKNSWIVPYLRQYRGLFLLAVSLGTLTILFGSALMFSSGYLISKAATRPESILMVYVPIVGVRAFGIGRAVLSYVERLTGHQLILKILSEMRERLYKVVEPQALFLKSRYRTGDILSVLSDDIEHLQDFYLKTLLPSVVSLTVYTVTLIVFGLFSIPFALLLAMLMGLLLFVGPILSLLYMKAKNEQLKIGRNRLYQHFTDVVFGISDWIFSGKYNVFLNEYEKQEQQLLAVETKKHRFVIGRDICNQVVMGLIVLLTMHWASDHAVESTIHPTLIAAFVLMMLSMLESFLPIAGAVSETTSYQDSVRRLEQIEGNKFKNVEDKKENSIHTTSTIEWKDVTFAYSESNLLIKQFCLNIKHGEKMAIIGRSGGGKSTLLKILQGALKPSSGEVLIDGVNVSCIDTPKTMAVLNQKAYLFNTTVLNNVRLGNPNATEEDVHRVCGMVQLHEMITHLPNGYHTNMEETGQRFSGGERQRIALARILLQNTPIVILDEPTVGLDPITESNLLKTIFNTLEEKTIIWVTHHLIGVEKMDRVLFLDEGKVIMDGTHSELIATNDRYKRLYRLDQPVERKEDLAEKAAFD